MDSPIPAAYRIWFATLDPLIASTGVLGNIFSPHDVLNSYYPKAADPPAIDTKVLLDTSSGFYLGIMFLQIVLLRLRSRDVTVWKCVQASIAIVDVAIIAAVLMALDTQDRLSPSLWRWQEAGTFCLTSSVLVSRLLFVCGVGLIQSGNSNLKWE